MRLVARASPIVPAMSRVGEDKLGQTDCSEKSIVVRSVWGEVGKWNQWVQVRASPGEHNEGQAQHHNFWAGLWALLSSRWGVHYLGQLEGPDQQGAWLWHSFNSISGTFQREDLWLFHIYYVEGVRIKVT